MLPDAGFVAAEMPTPARTYDEDESTKTMLDAPNVALA
jgi:hypothetical protein